MILLPTTHAAPRANPTPMPTSPQGFQARIDRLKADLVRQGGRVRQLVEAAMDAAFDRNVDAARGAAAFDEEVDRVDVEIEKAAVAILTDACSVGATIEPAQVRMVLTIVKVNNELERIADVGVEIAELVPELRDCTAPTAGHGATPLPPTFRVLANSVIGIVRDCVASLDRLDPELAKVVLLSEEAVGEFKRALLGDAQSQLVAGKMSLALASALHDVANHSVTIVDHCTNVSEQVLYAATGRIMRHMQGKWEEVRFA